MYYKGVKRQKKGVSRPTPYFWGYYLPPGLPLGAPPGRPAGATGLP